MAILGVITFSIILTFGFINAPRDWKGTRPILSSYVVTLIGISLYIMLPAILILGSGNYTWAVGYYSEETFSRAIWLCTLGLSAFLFGNAIFRRYGGKTRSEIRVTPAKLASHLPSQSADVLLLSLLGVGLALKIFLIINTGGFENSVTRFSGYARQFSGVDLLDANSIVLRTISGIADGAATWGVLTALRERHLEKTWLLVLLATLALSYVTMGKRLVLLLPVLCVLIGVHIYRRSLTIRLVPLVIALSVGAGFITLMARAFVPASVLGYDIDLGNIAYSDGSIFRFYLYSLEFSSLEMISVAMLAGPQIIDMFGGTWNAITTTNFEPFLYSVPRALWPQKPDEFYDLSYGISAALGDTHFENPTVGYASTLIGTAYLLGGIICVIIAMFALGSLTARIDFRFSCRNQTDMSIILYAIALVVVFHLFRQGTLGWTFIVSIVQQYGTIAALLILAMHSRTVRGDINSHTKQS
ncbi:hypothetical protein NGTWS1803_28450 [Mycolicibacterium cyprinidarum]|nr:hypothetical protein NGTWS1803_28450 [Mycolicibacterium sp. NGTWS1803]